MQEGVTQAGNGGNVAADIDVSVKTENIVLPLSKKLSEEFLSRKLSLSKSFSIEIERKLKFNIVERDQLDVKNKENLPYKRLAYVNKPELPALLIGSIAAGIHGVAFPVFGFLMATAFGVFFEPPNELQKKSRFWALMFVSVGAVVLVAAPVQSYMFGVSGGKLVRRMRASLFGKIVRQEISWFDDPANSRLDNYMMNM